MHTKMSRESLSLPTYHRFNSSLSKTGWLSRHALLNMIVFNLFGQLSTSFCWGSHCNSWGLSCSKANQAWHFFFLWVLSSSRASNITLSCYKAGFRMNFYLIFVCIQVNALKPRKGHVCNQVPFGLSAAPSHIQRVCGYDTSAITEQRTGCSSIYKLLV